MEDFEFLPESRYKHPAMSKLFKVRTYTQGVSTYRDALCLGCASIRRKAKACELVNHVFKCKELHLYDEESVEELKNQVSLSEKRDPRSQQLLLSRRQLDFYNKLVDFIAVNCLALATVESPEFKALFEEKTFKFPSRWVLTHKLLPTRATELQRLALKSLETIPGYTLTLEFDGWKSSSGYSLLGMAVTNLEGQSILVDLIDISNERHTSEHLASIAINCMRYGATCEKI